MALNDLISNGQKPNLDQYDRYAAIVGLNPSQGARSPTLWNKVFDARSLRAAMVPLDVPESKLAKVVDTLRKDDRFIGGAVAVPYKTQIIETLDAVDEQAAIIGAVNVVFRRGKQLVGSNTDGAAAIAALKEKLGRDLRGLRVVQIGAGGAGTAVAAYLAQEIGRTGFLVIANRSMKAADALASKLKGTASKSTSLANISQVLANCDVLINCSSVGMELWRSCDAGVEYLRPFTPLGSLPAPVSRDLRGTAAYLTHMSESISANHRETLQVLGKAKQLFVYDIIYQPVRTMLLEMASWAGFATLNGESMNLRQAVMAFHKAASAAGLSLGEPEEIEQVMLAPRSS